MKEKKKINGWKLTAIVSLIINGIIALLLTIGLASPRSYVKTKAYNEVYDTNKIVLTTNNINSNVDYYLYFDWVNQSVEGSSELYYFPISNLVAPFSVYISRSIDVEGYNVTYFIEKTSLGGNFRFACSYQGNDYNIGIIRNQIEPRSIFLVFEDFQNCPNYDKVLIGFKSLFNGSIPLSTDTIRPYRPSEAGLYSLDFLISYFSQYSVQNLEVGLKTDSNTYFRQVDFSTYDFGVYGMGEIDDLSYSFQQNTLIHSDSRLVEQDFPIYMPLLNGSFFAKEYHSAVLVAVWKEVWFPQLPSAGVPVYYDLYFNNQRLIHDNGYYYYLDSINFYDVGAEELGETLFSCNYIDYNQEFEWSSGVCNYSTRLAVGTLSPLVIRKLNLYPSQRIEWINFSNVFNITNHFYFSDGAISNPSIGNDNNINGNNVAFGNVFVIIKNGFESIMPLLGTYILPGISIGMLCFLPLIGTIIIVIIKLVKR